MTQWRDDRQLLAHYSEILKRGTPRIPFDGMTKSSAYVRFINEMHANYYAQPLALAVSFAVRIKKYRESVHQVLNLLIIELDTRLNAKIREICQVYEEVPPDSEKPLVTRKLDEVAPFTIKEVLEVIEASNEQLYYAVAAKMHQE